MKKNTTILFILTLFSFQVFGQIKTDVEKNDFFGKVKTTLSFNVSYEGKIDTSYISKDFYNENGMKIKYIPFEKDYGYKPIRGTDSISSIYDAQNKLIQNYDYYWFRDNYDETKINRKLKTKNYVYYQICNKISSELITFHNITEDESDRDTIPMKTTYRYDKECKVIYMEEIGSGRTKITENNYDYKGRIIKRTFTYKGDKPNTLETYQYEDKNNTLTYVEYSPRYDVYRGKTVTQFNKNNKVIQKTFYNAPTAGGSITFSEGSKSEPDQIHLIRKYQYNSEDKLIGEIHLDGNNNELIKVEIFYDEKGELKEQKFYKMGKLEYREEYKYENEKKIEEKKILPKKKTPEYVKTRRYNDNGQLIELIQLVDGDKYSNEYVYDSFKNEIEKRELKNGKLLSTEFTKIEYYP